MHHYCLSYLRAARKRGFGDDDNENYNLLYDIIEGDSFVHDAR